MISHPNELEWIESDLPDIHSVNKNCRILAWLTYFITEEEYSRLPANHNLLPPEYNGHLSAIYTFFPYEDQLNSLRWVDQSGFPLSTFHKVKYWAWIKK